MLEARCHCGAVTINLPRRPRVLTECNCSICRKLKPLFAYYTVRTILIGAPEDGLESYLWGRRTLRWYRCRACGCFTHHLPAGREDNSGKRSGVNMRLVDPAELHGVPVNVRNGAADTWGLLKSYQH